MKCPFCSQENTRVIDSRPADDNSSIRRRRLCDACGKRFTTYEKIETIPVMVIKKDNNREHYDRSKIEDGILRACHKRPVPLKNINAMIDGIERVNFQPGGAGDSKLCHRRDGHGSLKGSGFRGLRALCLCIQGV